MTTVTISDSLCRFTITLPQEDAVNIRHTILKELHAKYCNVKSEGNPQSPFNKRTLITYLDIGVIVFLAGGALFALLK